METIGQFIISEIHDIIEEIQRHYPRTKITLIWNPGHIDIEGNEVVDKAAKEAAQDE
jgi:ribonuclease HI